MRPELSPQQGEALAAYLVTLRPGQRGWTKDACFAAIRKAALEISRDAELVERAAIRCARNPRIITPQVIGMPGEHWEAAKAPGEGTRARRCDQCHVVHTSDSPCAGERAQNHQTHIDTARKNLGIPTKERA